MKKKKKERLRSHLDKARAVFLIAEAPKDWVGFRTQLHFNRLNLLGAVVNGFCNWIESLMLRESCCWKKEIKELLLIFVIYVSKFSLLDSIHDEKNHTEASDERLEGSVCNLVLLGMPCWVHMTFCERCY